MIEDLLKKAAEKPFEEWTFEIDSQEHSVLYEIPIDSYTISVFVHIPPGVLNPKWELNYTMTVFEKDKRIPTTPEQAKALGHILRVKTIQFRDKQKKDMEEYKRILQAALPDVYAVFRP